MKRPLASPCEGTKARRWREDIMRLSIKQLAERTGYSVTAIRCFEANENSAGELIGEAAWRRYRMACAGVLLMHDDPRGAPVWDRGTTWG